MTMAAEAERAPTLLKAKLLRVKFEWDGPSDETQAAYYPGDNYVDVIGIDACVGDGATNDSAALADWTASITGQRGWLNLSYLLTFSAAAQQAVRCAGMGWSQRLPSKLRTGNPIITQFANLFASLSLGPRNAVLVAQSYWDNDAACAGCGLGDYAGKKAAYG